MTLKRQHKVFAGVFLLFLLSGCYLPVRFDAEIEVTRNGLYDIAFDGYLVDIPIYDGLNKKKLTPKQEKAKVALLVKDFKRDSAVKEFAYYKKGYFRVKWEKNGNILRSNFITFFRRNENFISIKYLKTKGIVMVAGTPVGKTKAKQLTAIGLGMKGQLRLKTGLPIISHNANKVRNLRSGQKLLIWDIKNLFDKSPKATLRLR
ncbi:MAG TPA: hypothetical protein ENI72_02115 [Rhodospirillales bacterium]|nr:hypothetical protein [Rhodospirillales bacterium]